MAGKWKPGDLVRLKGTMSPRMTVGGANAKDPNKIDCDWFEKGKPKRKAYHEDQLEAVGDDDDDFLPITMD